GFLPMRLGEQDVYTYTQGLFPPIVLIDSGNERVGIKVESAADFCYAQQLDDRTLIEGAPLAPLRRVRVAENAGVELWAVERHAYRGFDIQPIAPEQTQAVLYHREAFRRRQRHFASDR